jgi:CHASE3 domain sensor protein
MRHLAVRVILLLVAVTAAGGGAYFIIDLEGRATAERVAEQSVRDRAKALLASIAELMAGQRSYVAAGQGHQFWTARMTQVLQTLDPRIRELRNSLQSDTAASALDAAVIALDNFKKLDARAQEYVSLNQDLLASDLIFSDGLEMTGTAAAQVDAALNEEIAGREGNLAMLRQWEALAAAGAGAVVLLVALLLTPRAGRKQPGIDALVVEEQRSERAMTDRIEVPMTPSADLEAAPDLEGAARLCTELGRVMETGEIPPLLARAADILDAGGLVVWVSDRTGAELKPVLAHGYPDRAVAQMRSIPRDAQNAAGMAFRSSQMRVVAGDELSNGALVVPLVTPAGCVGVLAAELRHGGEQREATRALATILAAQLATLVGAAPSPGAVKAQA